MTTMIFRAVRQRLYPHPYGGSGSGFNLFLSLVLLAGLLGSPTALRAADNIIMLGDSITAGYGLAPTEALPVRLQAAIRQAGRDAQVENAGVSGDTTAAALARVDWTIGNRQPDLVIVALGGNDGLRGIDPVETRKNVLGIVQKLKSKKIPVLLAGMLAPRNLGPDYAAIFDPIFSDVATAEQVALYPFLLDGVAADPSMNQPDGIHPSAEGADLIARRMAPHVIRALDASLKK